MRKSHLSLPLLVFGMLCFLLLPSLALSAPFRPSDVILLNCGSLSDAADADKRTWKGNSAAGLFVELSNSSSSFSAQADTIDPSLPSHIPYKTARVFNSAANYTFKNLSSGSHFVRLYFFPSSYNYHEPNNSFFSVISSPYILLANFSPAITAKALNLSYIVREFFLTVPDSASLTLTFIPTPTIPNSFAFINGIEIVSSPKLFFSGPSYSSTIVGLGSPFPVQDSAALQTVIRLNVGGSYIAPPADSGLFRTWYNDMPYILAAGVGVSYPADGNVTLLYSVKVPEYIAPGDVYKTARSMGPTVSVNLNYNLTWLIPVDNGFRYLLRLHFCEIQSEITMVNQRVFRVYVNNITAESELDVIFEAQKVVSSPPYIGVAVYRDYVIILPKESADRGRSDLWVALHPNMENKPQYADAILNGLEIFKINDSSGNLAGPNPDLLTTPFPETYPNPGNRRKIIILAASAGGLVAAGVAGVYVCSVLLKRQKKKRKPYVKDGDESIWTVPSPYANGKSPVFSVVTKNSGSSEGATSYSFRHFTFSEIVAATNNFDNALLLGVGGFGKVYKGVITSNTQGIAIKRGSQLSQQGAREFQNEIEVLSNLRHRHLVSLMGYCEDSREMILVYEYMANGTLREHLFGSKKPPLPWKQRLEICIGAAKGLHYLHTGAKHTIIHRDVKTTNILLDEKWVAKVSDFGLSRNTCSIIDGEPVSTVVKGTFGYVDPEYYRTHQITEKSDVYSFGVVLLEVLCARPALDRSRPASQICLAEWAIRCQRKGVLTQIIDPFLAGKIANECLNKFVETVFKCLAETGVDRPTMANVLWNLEFALSLQLSAEEANMEGRGFKREDEAPLFVVLNGTADDTSGQITDPSDTSRMSTGSSVDSVRMHPSAVFSQIMYPTGR